MTRPEPEPTLIIHIPFLLLGTANISPNLFAQEDDAAGGYERLVDDVVRVLSEELHGVGVGVEAWVPKSSKDRVPREEQEDDASDTQWDDVHTKTQSVDTQWVDEESRTWDDVSSRRKWILRPGTASGQDESWIGAYSAGDAELVARERDLLGNGAWCVSLILQQHNIPLSSVSSTLEELSSLLTILREFPRTEVQGQERNIWIVCNSTCRLNLAFTVPAKGGITGVWKSDVLANLLVGLAA
jgi:hypothetical protein